ncbi:glycosyltransferase involved in cell wall biosynthesis [Agromyces sp. 3263]|uniref:glycosyltransferase family 2 protein n=1 Tax=Agromyces sp. 3263 TaxID=2817750 RepID=UPI0028593087|nr:glycosyltransferase family 2 protein [Agromyces sp. 3263]MDR6904961.1 glycosyltransferase involved in cell wall biosynthesis [Agromyces sp. 3263]
MPADEPLTAQADTDDAAEADTDAAAEAGFDAAAEAGGRAGPAGQVLTLSIVVPVRNDRDRLERLLASVAAQSVAPDEIVIVDNGGNGDLGPLAARYGCRVVPEPVVGIPAATSTGLDAASGDLLARVDADTVLPPDWVRDAHERFADPGVEAVTGWAWLPSAPPLASRVLIAAYLGAYTVIAGLALGHRPLWGSSALLRRALWLAVRDDVCRHDQRVHDDLDLSLHLPPGTRVLRDQRLSVGVSTRPFRDPGKLWRYASMGVHTFRKHWPEEFPPYRWARIARARRAEPRRAHVRWAQPRSGGRTSSQPSCGVSQVSR